MRSMTDEGAASAREISQNMSPLNQPPHPPFQGTFSRKGRR